MSGSILQRFRPAAQYARRRRHNYLSNEIWAGTGSVTTADVVGLQDDGSGNTVRNESGGPWIPFQTEVPPLTYGTGGVGSMGEVLNLKEKIFERLAPGLNSPGFKYAPVDLSSWPEPQARGFSTHLLYNVKTWRLQATIGGVSFDQDIPAGAVTTLGSEGARPNDGKRGKYGFSAGLTDSVGLRTVTIDASIGIGTVTTGDIENASEFLFSDPVDNILLPEIRLTINASDPSDPSLIGQELSTFYEDFDARGSAYSGVNICGVPFLLHDRSDTGFAGGNPWSFSLALTLSPKTLWGTNVWQS